MKTIFDEIAEGTRDAYIVWKNESYLAFLTPFPNTPGLTVIIPRSNPGDYVFNLSDALYLELMRACKEVAGLLEKALEVPRVALVFEGTGIAYVHAKLIPLHGELASKTDVWSDHTEFTEQYKGFLTTAEGPRMDDSKLREIQEKMLAVQKA